MARVVGEEFLEKVDRVGRGGGEESSKVLLGHLLELDKVGELLVALFTLVSASRCHTRTRKGDVPAIPPR